MPAGGEPGRLFVTAMIEPGWHIYSLTQPSGGPIATKIEVDPLSAVRLAGKFQPSAPPDRRREPAFDNLVVETHHGTVTWAAPIEVTAGADPSRLKIVGKVVVQPCDANSCLPPAEIPFTAKLVAGPPPTDKIESKAPCGVQSKYSENRRRRSTQADFDGIDASDGVHRRTDPDLLPCVLPVVGLKILSFLEQSGHSRRHALVLNIWYSLGLLAVFLVLATLSAMLGLGWGQLFSFNEFNITLAAVVFVMGLSFLGVWEIPIPGFVGRGKAVELAEKEGFAGAFSKGVVTTLLATPCTAVSRLGADVVRQPTARKNICRFHRSGTGNG